MSQINETVSPTSLSGRKLSYPSEIDEKLVQWVKEEQVNGAHISPDILRKEALRLIQPYCYEFKASTGWLDKFLSRHRIVLHPPNAGKNFKHVVSQSQENKLSESLNMQSLSRTDVIASTSEEHTTLISPRGSQYVVVERPKEMLNNSQQQEVTLQKSSQQQQSNSLPTSLQESQIQPHVSQQHFQQRLTQQAHQPQPQTPSQNHLENGEDDEEDDDEDDNENKKEAITSPQKPVNPERLKAFNMFVRLFIDENLDRLVPISKQPKEKITAIIMSCQRQFPEFSDRARKRIRTYLKSCRRSTKLREPTSRPSMSHIPATQLNEVNNILAKACHNESQEAAKRQRLESTPKPNELYKSLDPLPNKTTISNAAKQNSGNSFPSTTQNDVTVFQSFMTSAVKQPLLKLSQSEVTSIRNLIEGYRQSASFLTRSADELERLLKQCSAYVDEDDKSNNEKQASNAINDDSCKDLNKTNEINLPSVMKEILASKEKHEHDMDIEIHSSSKTEAVAHVTSVISPTISKGIAEVSHSQLQSSTSLSENNITRTDGDQSKKTGSNSSMPDTNIARDQYQAQSKTKNTGLLIPVSVQDSPSKQKDKSLEPLIKKIKAEKNIASSFSHEIPTMKNYHDGEKGSVRDEVILRSPEVTKAQENEKSVGQSTKEVTNPACGQSQQATNNFKQESMEVEHRALQKESRIHTEQQQQHILQQNNPQHNEMDKYPTELFHGHLQQQFPEKQKRQHHLQQQHLQDHQQAYSPKEQKQSSAHFEQELSHKSSRGIITSPPALDHMHTQHYYSQQASPSLHTVTTTQLSQMQSYQASKHLQKLQGSYSNLADHVSPSPQHAAAIPAMQRGNHNSQHSDGDQLSQHSEHSSHATSYTHEYSSFVRQPSQQTARISPQMSQQQQINRTPHSANYHQTTPSGHHQNVFNFDQQMLESSHQPYLHHRLSPHINDYHPLLSPQDLSRQSTHIQDIARQSQLQNISRQPHIQELNRQQLLGDINRQNHVQDLNRHSDYQFTHGLPFDLHSSH